jgi:molybdopterin-guanine dinucleotide biosynthesis protein A
MISIAIQAGGRSSRMGTDKARLPVGGRRLIEYVIDCVEPYSDDLFITTNAPTDLNDLGLRLVEDQIPGMGALNGLKTALQAARHENVLVVACDMPLVQALLVEHMLSLSGEGDVIVPERKGRYEPLLAIYNSQNCLPALERALRLGEKRMISFFPEVEVLTIPETKLNELDPEWLSFVNVNTPDDALRIERLLAKHGKSDSISTE